jgi:glycosyltransferase involved in cell wall biosynthesis
MRILHIIGSLERGGAEVMLSKLINAMHEDVHCVISLTKLGPLGEHLIASGHNVHALNIRKGSFLLGLLALWRYIRAFKPNVIQTWMYHSDLLGGVVGRLAGIPNIIWNIRNTEIPQGKLSKTYFIIRICALLSSYVPRRIVCCADAALRHHEMLGYCKAKMIAIPNGYLINSDLPDSREILLMRQSLGIASDVLIIGAVGRFDPLKGYDIFIEAANFIEKSFEGRILFLMIGRQMTNENILLKKLISDKGGDAKFMMIGERNDASKLISVLDIFCLSSRSEGFPNVVAEAMLMQVPCVVTDVGDARKIVGKDGVVVNKNDPQELANGILELLNMHHEERNSLGISGRTNVINNYSIDAVSKKYAKIYRNLN